MAKSKRDWQQDSNGQTRPSAMTSGTGGSSWRNAPRSLRSRVLAQLGLLRIPAYLFIAVGLVWALVHVTGWLRPVEPPRLTIISSTYDSPLLPMNTFASEDARALIGTGLFHSGEASSQSQSYESLLASIRGIGRHQSKGFLSKVFHWRHSTDFVYVNTLGLTLTNANGDAVPCLLPDDFDPATVSAEENAVPVTELLDAVAASSADRKVVVFDCRRVEQLWSRGVIENQFVAKVTELLQQNAGYAAIDVVFSSAVGEKTWLDGSNRQSAFGRFFAKGLQGAADESGNGDNRVTLAELDKYLSRNVPRWVDKNRMDSQHPFTRHADADSELVLALVGASAATESEEESKTDVMLADLREAWTTHEALANQKHHPTRFAPTAWARLQESLLRAEAYYRATDADGVDRELTAVGHVVTEIQQLAENRPGIDTPWSLIDARVAVEKAAAKLALQQAEQVGSEVAAADAEEPAAADTTKPEVVPGKAVPLIVERPQIKTLAEAVSAMDRYLDGDLTLDAAAELLLTAHANNVTLFAEAELLLMLADSNSVLGDKRNPEWAANVQRVIGVRQLAETASVPAPQFAADVLPWIVADLKLADAAQRVAEDEVLRGQEPPIRIGEPEDGDSDASRFHLAMQHADSLARAYRLREQTLAELPFLVRAAGRRVLDGDEFHEAFADHVLGLLEQSHKLHFALNAKPHDLEPAERHGQIAAIDAIAGEVTTARAALMQHVHTAADELVQTEGRLSETAWRRVDLLLALPVPLSGTASHAVATRGRLLKRIHNQAAADDAAESEMAASTATRLQQTSRRERLAALWFSLGEASPVAIAESGRAHAAEIEVAWQRLWKNGTSRDGSSDLAVRMLSSSAPAGIARVYIDRTQANFFCWQAQRRLDDFWAGSSPAAESWFAQSAGEFIAVAERLNASGDGTVEAAAGRLTELVELAEVFRESTDTSLISLDKRSLSFKGTDTETARLRFRPDSVWPTGIAHLHCAVNSDDIDVAATRVGDVYEVAVSRTSAAAKETALQASVMFRGHRCTSSLPISTNDEAAGPTLVYESDLPATGKISVQWARTNAAGSSLLFVIDASGSMGRDGRMDSVRESLLRFAQAVSDTGMNVGVRVFGDRVAWDGTDPRLEAQARADTRLLLPIRPFAGDEFRNAVASLQPRGETPLFRALLDARNDFPTEVGDRTIVVISDGADNWALAGATPGVAEMRAAYADSGIRIDTVGFQTDANGFRQLQQISAATGGKVVQATKSDDLLKSLFGLVNMRQFEVVSNTIDGEQIIDSGTLGRASVPTAVPPGDYFVRVLDREGTVVAQHPTVRVTRGQHHRLLYSGTRLQYAKLNVSNDLAVVRDEETQTTLRVMSASRAGNGLELSIAVAREHDPTWQPRDVQLRIRPRGGRDVFAIQSLRPNIEGLHIPAWRCRLANWPDSAQFAEVDVSWAEDEHAPREQFTVNWEGEENSLPQGFSITRRTVGTIRGADGKSRDVATLTLVAPSTTPGDWSFRFDNPPTFAQQVWNRSSGIHTSHVQFENGEVPSRFRIEAPIGDDEARERVKATVGLRLRSISRR